MKNNCFNQYKDKYKHQRCFIVANGPSLNDTNLDLIKDDISFAMNRISLIYPTTEFRPTYYLFASTNINNPIWGNDWHNSVIEAINCPKTTSFIYDKFKDKIIKNTSRDICWIESVSETKPNLNGDIDPSCFSTNIVSRIDKSGTSINIAFQIAYHMGFKEICIIGADLDWKADNGTKSDPNHFDKNYVANIPNPRKANMQMRNVHKLILKKFQENGGVNIYNASKKTVLDTYPIIDFEEYVLHNNIIKRENDMNKAKEFWSRL